MVCGCEAQSLTFSYLCTLVQRLNLGGTEATYKIPKRIYDAPNPTALQNRPRVPGVYRGPADNIQGRAAQRGRGPAQGHTAPRPTFRRERLILQAA